MQQEISGQSFDQLTVNAAFLPVGIWLLRLILVNFRELYTWANPPSLKPRIARLLDAATEIQAHRLSLTVCVGNNFDRVRS
jgi:hypothetical protein